VSSSSIIFPAAHPSFADAIALDTSHAGASHAHTQADSRRLDIRFPRVFDAMPKYSGFCTNENPAFLGRG